MATCQLFNTGNNDVDKINLLKKRVKMIKTVNVYEFSGYEEIVKEFWGIPENFEPTGKWDKISCIMFDLDELIQVNRNAILAKHRGQNEKEISIKVGGNILKVFSLYGEGGFYGVLVRLDDIKKFENSFGLKIKVKKYIERRNKKMDKWKFKIGSDVLDEEGVVVSIGVQNSSNEELEKRYFVKYPDGKHAWRTEEQLSELPSLKTNNKKEKNNASKTNSRSENKKVASKSKTS